MVKELILGGARSGKSRLAERRAQQSGLQLVYVATGQAGDEEMAARIALHRQQRGEQWRLREEPVRLAEVLLAEAKDDTCILVDCLTLWLSNCLFSDEQDCWPRERQALLDCLAQLPGQIIFVGNEVGMGVIPMGQVTREFVDENGWLQQALAELCQRVTLTVAGLPHSLKDES